MKFFSTLVPEGHKALVTNRNGKIEIVNGPRRISRLFFSSVVFFERVVLTEGESGILINELGNASCIEGPAIVHIYPELGVWHPDKRIELASNEAVVIVDSKSESNDYRIVTGKEVSVVLLNYRQRLMEFRWTGSLDGNTEKQPGALRFDKLRLNDTQTYLSFSARTADNVVVRIEIMIYYEYNKDIKKLIDRDDPMGAMYNKVISELVKFIAGVKFEDFKDGTSEKISQHQSFNPNSDGEGWKYFSNLGIDIQQVVLKSWQPADSSVQRVLDQAATILTQKALDEAQHQRVISNIGNEDKELAERSRLNAKKNELAQSEGEQEGAKLVAIFNKLKEGIGEESAKQLLLIHTATKADQLVISPEMLRECSVAKS